MFVSERMALATSSSDPSPLNRSGAASYTFSCGLSELAPVKHRWPLLARQGGLDIDQSQK